jgi:hypothetical protein
MCERPNFELQSSAAHDSLCLSGACCKTKRNSPSSFFSHGKRPATPAKRAQVMQMITRETTQKFEKLQRLKRKFKNKITFPSKLRAALVCAGWRQQGCERTDAPSVVGLVVVVDGVPNLRQAA